ncbi:MAG: RNA-binding protein [candidate division Zixibacteria bacterium]|jgi:RNA recognition motif-containing protein|nr:RNA-binding protein [candidate division Zixibacteria bacterium]
MDIYVGNLSYQTTEDELKSTFEQFGQVASVRIVKDKFSGDSKGYGFVEMGSKEEAAAAISGLDGKELNGRTLKVNEARPREQGGRGGNRERRGGGGGGRRSW